MREKNKGNYVIRITKDVELVTASAPRKDIIESLRTSCAFFFEFNQSIFRANQIPSDINRAGRVILRYRTIAVYPADLIIGVVSVVARQDSANFNCHLRTANATIAGKERFGLIMQVNHPLAVKLHAGNGKGHVVHKAG